MGDLNAWRRLEARHDMTVLFDGMAADGALNHVRLVGRKIVTREFTGHVDRRIELVRALLANPTSRLAGRTPLRLAKRLRLFAAIVH